MGRLRYHMILASPRVRGIRMHSDQNLSQTEKAVLGLRGLIVQGQLKPGQRVFEQTLVDLLGVSRTPARAALQRICEEGFIALVPKRGYVVSSFTRQDVFDAIAIRGTLEGMAARLAAEKGPPPHTLAAMHECLRALDLALAEPDMAVRQSEYARLNDRLHELLCEAAQSPMMERALQRLAAIPFSLNNSFTDVPASAEQQVAAILRSANEQHYSLVEAIEQGEGARAEALAIEHSRSTWKYLMLMLQASEPVELPGGLQAALRGQCA